MKNVSEMCLGAGLWTSVRTQFHKKAGFVRQWWCLPFLLLALFVPQWRCFSNLTREAFLSSRETLPWNIICGQGHCYHTWKVSSTQSPSPNHLEPCPLQLQSCKVPPYSSVLPMHLPVVLDISVLQKWSQPRSLSQGYSIKHDADKCPENASVFSHLSQTWLGQGAAATTLWSKDIITETQPFGSWVMGPLGK